MQRGKGTEGQRHKVRIRKTGGRRQKTECGVGNVAWRMDGYETFGFWVLDVGLSG